MTDPSRSRIAVLVNQYPKVSHTFIRREILSLERQGIEVLRIALRGWDGSLVDDEDERERARTRYVLERGVLPLLIAAIRTLVSDPRRFLAAFVLALRTGFRADRPLPYHLIYLAEACRVLPWLRSFGAGHVHAHFGDNAAEVAMLVDALGGPAYSFTVHGPGEFDKPQFIGLGEKVRRSAFVVAVSSFGRSQVYRWVEHAQWPKVKVVHCGLERTFHEGLHSPVPSVPRLVCVGRICEAKGQLLLVDAIAQLAARGVRFEMVLAGDGELRPEVEALIARHRLERQVLITGWISSSQVRDQILASRGLVLPSFAEGLPVVIMEAMALRRPVLATYVAGIPELVKPGENGWLVPPGDVDQLSLAMEDLLLRSVEELRVMGESAHATVLARHSVDSETAKLTGYVNAAAAGA